MAPSANSPNDSPISPSTPTSTEALTRVGMKKTIADAMNHFQLPGLDASKLTITRTTNPGTVPKPNSAEVWAQKTTTDHMLTVSWSTESGWGTPEIKPYGPLSLEPTASVLHYATECFEGMKAYRGYDGKLRIFRPERNCARMLKSATRISLPAFDPAELQTLIERFVAFDGPKWLPNTEEWKGQFLYLRPTMIATNANIGVQKPTEALLYIIGVCFPPLDEIAPPAQPLTNGSSDSTGKTAPGMKLLASSASTIRAWPGGFGNAKVGANYGPSLVAQAEARERGYQQILWLFGQEGFVTEAGASNFFVVWKTQDGKTQLITAPLGDGIILEGVTRQSVLDLVRADMPEIDVVERKYKMDEVRAAYLEGRLIEAFGAGTAFFIAPVAEIHYRGTDVVLPESRKIAMAVKEKMRNIMFGRVQHPWGVVVDEEE
jgi:branched-chain amino acid aminotransferase